MKKLFILIFLLASISLQAQNVPDLIRTTPVPATGANKNNRATVDANLKAGLSFLPPKGNAYSLNGAKDSAGYLYFNDILKRLGVYRGAGIWDNPLNVVTTSYQNLNINDRVQVITDATANFGKSLYLPSGSTDPGVRPIYGPYLGLENGEYTYKFYLKINTNLTDTARFLHVDIAENGNSIMSTYIRYSDFIGANIWTPFRIVFNGVKGRNYECRIDVVHGGDPYPAQYPTKTNLWYDYGQIIGIREFVPTDLSVYATQTDLANGLNSLTSTNGLTKTGGNTQLGGNLIHPTYLNAFTYVFGLHGANSRYTYDFSSSATEGEEGPDKSSIILGANDNQSNTASSLNIRSDGFALKYSIAGTTNFVISSDGTITDNIRNKGWSYTDNYFTTGPFEDRRIPDLGMVKSLFPAGGIADDANVVHKTGYVTQTVNGNLVFINNISAAYAAFPSASIAPGGNGLSFEGGAISHFYNGDSGSDYMLQNSSTGPTDTNNGLRIKQKFGLNTGSINIIGNNITDETGKLFLKTGSVPDSTTIANNYVTIATAQNISALKTLGSKSHAATFTIYGTSLATKFGFNGTWRYSDGYPYKLTKSLNFQLSLKGGTGNTTLTYTNAIAASPIPAYTAGDMIGFEVGVNDATNADATTYSTANYTIRVNSLISSAIAAGYPANRIYIFSAFYWTLGDPTRANDIVNATASIASTRGVLYFDGYNTYKSRVLDNTFTLSGGLHPTIAAQTVVAADMQTYLNAYTINSSVEFLNVFDAGSFNTLNSYGSASFTGNTTINNLKLNTSRVAAGDAIGDIYTRDADGFTTPIPAVAVGQVLISKGVGVPPDYSPSPVVTRLTSNQDIFISSARTGGGYSFQINQAFTPVANNQILSGGLIAPTFVTGTGALTATASGTTSATDGTVTAQATVTTSGTGSGATYTVTTVGNVATVVTMVVAGTGYATGDTFTIAALPGITFTVASLGYTGITRSAMTFANAPITLTTISTPPNPVSGQIWNISGVFKGFGAAAATRRFLLTNDATATANSVPIGNGTDFTITAATGTGSPVLGTGPTIAAPTFTTVKPASTFQTPTGTAGTDSLAVKIAATGKIGAISPTYYATATALTGYVPTTRTITTTLPLTGGGDLSANRTFGIGGLTAYGTANQVLGMNAAATGYEYKTITAGTNVSVTQGVNSITIAATGNPVVEISGTTQAAAANTIYIPHNAALTSITMPTTTVIGSLYQVIGEGAGGWKLILPTGAVAVGVGGFTTTSGGSLSSTDRYCTITIRLIATNKFSVTTSQGTITPL